MNGKETSLILGVTYRQFDYMLKQVDGLVSIDYRESMGKARNITAHDFTRLLLAFGLKANGYTYAGIQKAIDVLNDNWDGKSPEEAGVLLALGDKKNFIWVSNIDLIGYDKKTLPATTYESLPNVFSVKKVANDVYIKEMSAQ